MRSAFFLAILACFPLLACGQDERVHNPRLMKVGDIGSFKQSPDEYFEVRAKLDEKSILLQHIKESKKGIYFVLSGVDADNAEIKGKYPLSGLYRVTGSRSVGGISQPVVERYVQTVAPTPKTRREMFLELKAIAEKLEKDGTVPRVFESEEDGAWQKRKLVAKDTEVKLVDDRDKTFGAITWHLSVYITSKFDTEKEASAATLPDEPKDVKLRHTAIFEWRDEKWKCSLLDVELGGKRIKYSSSTKKSSILVDWWNTITN